MRQRQLASLRAEHAHALCEVRLCACVCIYARVCVAHALYELQPHASPTASPLHLHRISTASPTASQVREEHEDVSRRTLRRAQRVQGLALALLPKVQQRARLRLAWVALCGGVEASRAERMHAEEARRLRAEVSDERERGVVEAAAAAKEAEMRAGWAATAEREAAAEAAEAAAAAAAQREQQLALMATQRDAAAAERAAEQGVAEAARSLAQQAPLSPSAPPSAPPSTPPSAHPSAPPSTPPSAPPSAPPSTLLHQPTPRRLSLPTAGRGEGETGPFTCPHPLYPLPKGLY